MTQSTIPDAEFKIAVEQDGAAYRAARDAIVQRGPSALAFLEPKQSSSDWKTALTASILVGWLRNCDSFDRCTEAVFGRLSGGPTVTGSWTADRRIRTVAHLGNVLTPRLLEMALKTRELGEREQTETTFGLLVVWNDPRAVVPLIRVLEVPARTTTEELVRQWAATTLGGLEDKRAVGPLLAVMRDVKAPEMLRAAAGGGLGTLGAREALPDLRAVAADESADVEYREAAIRAIGALHDADSAPPLLRTLPGTRHLPFEPCVVFTVGEIGTPSVLPA